MRRTTEIILMIIAVLFILENVILGIALFSVERDERQMKECYWDVCAEYPQASFEDDICLCYDYNVLGELKVVHRELIS